MNIAFLFNSDHQKISGCYGDKVMQKILATEVVQKSSCHTRISIGDVIWFRARGIEQQIYQPKSWDRLYKNKLEETFGNAVVFCWLFQNMTKQTGEDLHRALKRLPFYLGAMDVDFSNPLCNPPIK